MNKMDRRLFIKALSSADLVKQYCIIGRTKWKLTYDEVYRELGKEIERRRLATRAYELGKKLDDFLKGEAIA